MAGDLVFFRIARGEKHVGIYLRNGTFAHASCGHGVTFSKLTDSYWAERFWTARRILNQG